MNKAKIRQMIEDLVARAKADMAAYKSTGKEIPFQVHNQMIDEIMGQIPGMVLAKPEEDKREDRQDV